MPEPSPKQNAMPWQWVHLCWLGGVVIGGLMLTGPMKGSRGAALGAAVVAAVSLGGLLGWLLRARRSRAARANDADLSASSPAPSAAAEPADDQRLLGQIIDSIEGGVMTVSSDGTVTSFNPVAQETLGYDAHDIVGQHYSTVFGDIVDNRAIRGMIAAAIKGHQTFSSEEVEVAKSNGELVSLGVTLSQLRDPAGHTRGTVLMFKDLAKLMSLREHVRRTDQLASLGRLSAGMAHEIRNPLGSLHGLVELIQEDFAEDDPKRKYTGTILRTIGQLNELVENLLEFSQPPMTHVEPHTICDITHECVQFCSIEHRDDGVEIVEDYSAGPAWVRADRETLSRAIINIIRNAIQATPSGGCVSVSVRRVPAQDNRAECIAVDIHNTDSLVQPEDRDKLFTPFFTTKPTGTGLGLPIAHQIISAHSGQVEVESELDSGTTFSIMLPIVAEPSPALEQAPEKV
jgi:two-component system, NtrC family, sensor histidine kinase AtoS